MQQTIALASTIGLLIFWALIIVIIHTITKRKSGKKQSDAAQTAIVQIPIVSAQTNTTIMHRYRYRLKAAIMTPYEQKIFLTLNEIFSQKCYIIPQVHLSKLLEHKIKGQNWQGAFSHINGKSVDFVLLRKSTLEPLCAIELDDWTHTLQDRQERDREVEFIFQNAGLPLVRFHNIDKLSKQEIVDNVAQAIRH